MDELVTWSYDAGADQITTQLLDSSYQEPHNKLKIQLVNQGSNMNKHFKLKLNLYWYCCH